MMKNDNRFAEFENPILSVSELRDVIGPTFQPSVDKVIDHIDEIAKSYIKASTFIIVSSGNEAGQVEISPKGDPAGFVKVLDSKHIAIPDRPGNRRLDTLQNLLKNPQLAVLFLVPGMGETLRIYGEARIVRDPALLETMAINGRAPLLATVLYVDRVMIHCPKCVARSGLWSQATQPDPNLPRIGEVMSVHARLSGTAEEQEQVAVEAGMEKLY